MPRKGLLVFVGLENISRFDQAAQENLGKLLSDPEVWGVAPLPLDPANDVLLERQELVYRHLVKASVAHSKAIVVVSGSCAERQLEILQEESADFCRVALLNNTLDVQQQQAWLDQGAFVAFDGYVTYPENNQLREAAKATPLDRLLCASNEPEVTPNAIAQVPGGAEDVVWVVGELVELRQAFGREAFMEVYDALWANGLTVLGLQR